MYRESPGASIRRWGLIMVAGIVGMVGYFGPWVPHRAAGLIIPGLDLAEYVKFLPQFMSGQLQFRREIFYLPLLTASLTASLLASRRSLPTWLRTLSALAAIPLALAMLPPAWSPGLLRLPEFRLQAVAIMICLLMVPLSALLRYLPDRLVLATIALLALGAAIFPAWGFLQVGPAIALLYRQPLAYGWGFWMEVTGFTFLAFWATFETLAPHPRDK